MLGVVFSRASSPVHSANNQNLKRRLRFKYKAQIKRGVVVQLVRIPACHAGGRGFESRPLRQLFVFQFKQLSFLCRTFLCL
jgi:hypothetical protein